MDICGIICEYNPFHNGHLYQIEKTKKELSCDYIIAVMSGNFTMRGEPSLYNKYVRAKSAVMSGVDLVVELSPPYALSSSYYFARAGVDILTKSNVVKYISFGSESGDLEKLKKISLKLTDEKIKEASKNNINVFSAMESLLCDDEKEVLKTPNNILAINYIRAINDLKSDIIPYTVKREKTEYNSLKTNDNFASASGIRNLLSENKNIDKYIPASSYNIIKDEKPIFDKDFSDNIIYALRMKEKEDLLKYADVTEGLNNLFYEAGRNEDKVSKIIEKVKSKRYSETRIKRILYNILLDIPKELREKSPQYVRVLGFNEKGKEILKEIGKKGEIPFITNVTRNMFNEFECLKYDYREEDIYGIAEKKGRNNRKQIIF